MIKDDVTANWDHSIEMALKWATSIGLEPLDVELLLLHAISGAAQRNRAWLRTHLKDTLSGSDLSKFKDFCTRRADHQPLAYITGTREFFGLTLSIDHRVLDPRPDTEILVEWAISMINKVEHPVVADLGTGSGAIALAIKQSCPMAHIFAIDSCGQALTVAMQNANSLGLGINCLQGDWLTPLGENRCHLIASNPPYISENDPHLPALRHEPAKALISGNDGLNDIRHLIANAPHYLFDGGHLILEHGFDQSVSVQALMKSHGYSNVESRKDLSGHERCTAGTWFH